ncbi:MAG: aldose 1-epimerase [Terriglobia bacterium]
MSNYEVSTRDVEGFGAYRLSDRGRDMTYSLAPGLGNFGFEFEVHGKDVLVPVPSLGAYASARRMGGGNPFLAPWANRIDRDHFFFRGEKYLLNTALKNLRLDSSGLPTHGLLVFEPRWQVVESGASETEGAFVTTRLEFYKYPDLMAQFPFAQDYEVTHRLRDGQLEVITHVTNVGASTLPVVMAYHPYFSPDGPRDEWTVGIGARTHWILDERNVATGAREPMSRFLPDAGEFVLGSKSLDDEFSDLDREASGRGRVWVKGQSQRIEVSYGEGFDFAVVYAPVEKKLICIEPQTGPTNVFNLQHEGKFDGLIVLEPGKTFTARYGIVPSGF